MNFANEYNLLYLWLAPLLVLVFWQAHKSLNKRLARFASSTAVPRLYQRPKMLLHYLLILFAFLLMIVALARPQFAFEWVERQSKGKDIHVVLDVSQSMLATDISPNRLERAKRKLSDLLSLLAGERVSLIAFAGASFVQCPLTRDYRAAKIFLDHLQPDLIPVQGTVVGEALRLALAGIKKSSQPESAAIILLTDGEDEGSEPLAAAKEAKALGVKVFTIGIGSKEGVPIPDKHGNYLKDRTGNLVLSRLDEATLQQIALLTGGIYVRSVHGDFDLEQVYGRGVRGLADTAHASSKKKVWHEHFYLPLLFAFLFLLVEFLLQVRVKHVVLLVAVLWQGQELQALGSEAHDAFAEKKYQEATSQFLQQEIDDPNDLSATYNRAVSQYFAKDYAGASAGFAKAAQSENEELALKSLFNLGNAQAAQGALQEAVNAYEHVLQRQPENIKAKENLAWAKKLLQQQQDKQKQDKQQQGEQQQGEQQQGEQKQGEQQQGEQQQGEQQQGEQQQGEQKQGEQQQGEQQQGEQQQGEQQHMSVEEVNKLLRQLGDKVGVKPRFQRRRREAKQAW